MAELVVAFVATATGMEVGVGIRVGMRVGTGTVVPEVASRFVTVQTEEAIILGSGSCCSEDEFTVTLLTSQDRTRLFSFFDSPGPKH